MDTPQPFSTENGMTTKIVCTCTSTVKCSGMRGTAEIDWFDSLPKWWSLCEAKF